MTCIVGTAASLSQAIVTSSPRDSPRVTSAMRLPAFTGESPGRAIVMLYPDRTTVCARVLAGRACRNAADAVAEM